MKALVLSATDTVCLEDRPLPRLISSSDAIVKVTKTSICGTDLHIIKGDVPACQPGRILGHEGVGIIQSVGTSVKLFKEGDHVLISCITSCATCDFCRQGMYSHCTSGGWILGKSIDGTQAEFVRIPYADSSLYAVPSGLDEESLVLLSDVFPTGFECGVQKGNVQPGCDMAIIGAGPIGLSTLIMARLYSPAKIISIDTDFKRLEVAKRLGATKTVDSSMDDAVAAVMAETYGKGCHSVIEAAGNPEAFELCQELLSPGGTLANIGVHGAKADLKLQKLWDKNITITTRLVDTGSTPTLLRLLRSEDIQANQLITHHFKLQEIEKAYDVFSRASQHEALKIIIQIQQ